jgi:hypothetical protein
LSKQAHLLPVSPARSVASGIKPGTKFSIMTAETPPASINGAVFRGFILLLLFYIIRQIRLRLLF